MPPADRVSTNRKLRRNTEESHETQAAHHKCDNNNPLPVDWSTKKDDFGRKFFYNSKTKQASWEQPVEVWFATEQGKKPIKRTLLNNDEKQQFFRDVYQKLSKELRASGVDPADLPPLAECHKVVAKLKVKEEDYEPVLFSMLAGDDVDNASCCAARATSPRRISHQKPKLRTLSSEPRPNTSAASATRHRSQSESRRRPKTSSSKAINTVRQRGNVKSSSATQSEKKNNNLLNWREIGRKKIYEYREKRAQQLEAARNKRLLMSSEFGSILSSDTKPKMIFNVTQGTYSPWPQKEVQVVSNVDAETMLKTLDSPTRKSRLEKQQEDIARFSTSPTSKQSRSSKTQQHKLESSDEHSTRSKAIRRLDDVDVPMDQDNLEDNGIDSTQKGKQLGVCLSPRNTHSNAFYHAVPNAQSTAERVDEYDFQNVSNESDSDESGHHGLFNKRQIESFSSMVFDQTTITSAEPDLNESSVDEFQQAIQEASNAIEYIQEQQNSRSGFEEGIQESQHSQGQDSPQRNETLNGMGFEMSQGSMTPSNGPAPPREFELLQKVNHLERALEIAQQERERGTQREQRWMQEVEAYRQQQSNLNNVLELHGLQPTPLSPSIKTPGSPNTTSMELRLTELLTNLHDANVKVEKSNTAKRMAESQSREAKDRVTALVQEVKEHKIVQESQLRLLAKLQEDLKESRNTTSRHETIGRELETNLELERLQRTREQEAANATIQHLESQLREADEIATQYETFYTTREDEALGLSKPSRTKKPDEKYSLLRKLRGELSKSNELGQRVLELTKQLEVAHGQVIIYRDKAQGAVEELIAFKHSLERNQDESAKLVMEENVLLKEKVESLRREVEQCVVHLKLGRSALSEAKIEQERLRAKLRSQGEQSHELVLPGFVSEVEQVVLPEQHVADVGESSQHVQQGSFPEQLVVNNNTDDRLLTDLELPTTSLDKFNGDRKGIEALSKSREWHELRDALDKEHQVELRRVQREAASIAASTVAHSRIEREMQLENIRAKFVAEVAKVRQESAQEVDLLNRKHSMRIEQVHQEMEKLVESRVQTAKEQFNQDLEHAMNDERDIAEANVNELLVEHEKELIRSKRSSAVRYLGAMHQVVMHDVLQSSFSSWRNTVQRIKADEVADLFGTAVDRINKATAAGKLAVLLNSYQFRMLGKGFRALCVVANSDVQSSLMAMMALPLPKSMSPNLALALNGNDKDDGLTKFSENVRRILDKLSDNCVAAMEECASQVSDNVSMSSDEYHQGILLRKEVLIRCLKRSSPELSLAEIDVAVTHLEPKADPIDVARFFAKLSNSPDGILAFQHTWHMLESRKFKCTLGAMKIRSLLRVRKRIKIAKSFRRWSNITIASRSTVQYPHSPYSARSNGMESMRTQMERSALEEELRSLHTQLQESKADVWKYKRKLISQFEKNSVELLRHHHEQHRLHVNDLREIHTMDQTDNPIQVKLPTREPVIPSQGHSSSWGSSSTSSYTAVQGT